jgi:hypothetical protein
VLYVAMRNLAEFRTPTAVTRGARPRVFKSSAEGSLSHLVAATRMTLRSRESDGERLQHLRSVLPCRVRVTVSTHPLFGELVEASGFKRWNGVLLLVVALPDGSPGTMRADATDIFATDPVEPTCLVLAGAGLQELHALVTTLRQRRSSRGRGK